jgi:hypothetical protein
MIWGNIHSDERLRLWKNLRNDIQVLPTGEQLNEVAKFCSYMPIGSRTLDFYTPDSWPTPWEILYNGTWCTNSISLLIFYTLSLSLDSNVKIELILVDDNSDRYLLPLIGDQYLLNYELNSVSDWNKVKDDFRIIERYSKEQIKKIT